LVSSTQVDAEAAAGVGVDVADDIASRPLGAFGRERLLALSTAKACALAEDGQRALLRAYDALTRDWGTALVGVRPAFPSNIADDEAPFEFALALCQAGTEVQVYVEPQAPSPSLSENLRVGRALLEHVAPKFGVPLGRLRLLEPLFFPEPPDEPQGAFALWIGASWSQARRAFKLKVYLNPQIRGATRREELVGEALRRLGFGEAWLALRSALRPVDELAILSLELGAAAEARVKVYVRHPGATLADIARMAAVAAEHDPRDLGAFYASVAGDATHFSGKPLITEFSFVDALGAPRQPRTVTLEFPLGAYVASDADAATRVRRCLARFGVASRPYDEALAAFARRPLADDRGLHAHVTFSRVAGLPRIGVYLASEAYRRGPARHHSLKEQP
jgi:DMATS type aromatic prenyltransferase